LIEAEIKLQLVEIPHWAGLGGVCYIPPEQRRSPGDPDFDQPYTPEELHLINHKNVQLINELRTLDKAFSLGEGGDGRMCIRFGMVSMDTDVEELLALVTRTGIDLDEQVNHLQNMEEMVRKGIQQAQTDLQKESEEVLWQEGILRHVPLVGSIYNWISPAQKMHIKGRTLSLNEGKLSTSDVLYKSPKTSITQESETKTEEVIIIDETSQETNSTHEQQPVSE